MTTMPEGWRYRLVDEYADRVARVVRRFRDLGRSRGYDVADLEQEGLIALWSSAESFDPCRGVSFWMYARQQIRWRILDLLRQADLPPSGAAPDDSWGLTEADNRDRGRTGPGKPHRRDRIAGDALAAAWSVLSGIEREVLWWRYCSGPETATWEKVAIESGLGLSTAMGIARKALAKLGPEVKKRING